MRIVTGLCWVGFLALGTACRPVPDDHRGAPTVAARAEPAATARASTVETAPRETRGGTAAPTLPCPGGRAACTPTESLVARGVVERAERYLETCLGCRDRAAVSATAVRARAAHASGATAGLTAEVDAALARGAVADAAQSVADAEPDVAPGAIERVRRRIERRGHRLDGSCRSAPGVALLVSPRSPGPDAPLRVLAVSEVPLPEAKLTLEGPAIRQTLAARTDDGPPWSWHATATAGGRGVHRVTLEADGVRACRRFDVGARIVDDDPWPVEARWSRDAENLWAAWVRHLFAVPVGTRFAGLSAVTEDPARNLLHGHLGLAEDDAGRLALTPDCADHPYVLRAYFSWKLRLPFVRHDCRRPTATGDAGCTRSAAGFELLRSKDGDATASDPAADAVGAEAQAVDAPRAVDAVAAFRRFARRLKDEVHARSLRTAPGDDRSDLYPVMLAKDRLRPGVTYSDPHGHTLTIVRWEPQRPDRPGQLVAADAQPDGTVAVKRFWRGTFVYTDAARGRGHGFKAFRPVVPSGSGWRPLADAEIGVATGYGDVDVLATDATAAEFYGALASFINPARLEPEVEYRELHVALHEQLVSRVREVDVADDFVAPDGSRPIDMPRGRAAFRSTGPWEALSTPCRDLRLLVGLDALEAYPAEAARDHAARARLEALHRALAAELHVEYPRSDGSRQRLTLGEVLTRREALETAYNPNDCPEVRWGAPEGSAEASSCRRRAPADQQRAMADLRHWFRKRYACG